MHYEVFSKNVKGWHEEMMLSDMYLQFCDDFENILSGLETMEDKEFGSMSVKELCTKGLHDLVQHGQSKPLLISRKKEKLGKNEIVKMTDREDVEPVQTELAASIVFKIQKEIESRGLSGLTKNGPMHSQFAIRILYSM